MHIDEDSAALTESMRVLRSRSNARVPISRLPDDILLMIFELFEEEKRLTGHDRGHYASVIDNAPACLEVTHVCRRWRNVALGCPTLWRFISSISPLWLDVMLQRSQKAPLVVTCKQSLISISREDYFETLLSHLPRIKHLKLYQTSDRIIDLLSSMPASMLETCILEDRGGLHPTASMSNTIFQAQAPLLRCLEVDSFDRRWSSCIFGGLRTLRVGGTSLPNLLSALRCMPVLEHLMFQHQFLSSDEPILLDKVPLARLKSIAIEAMLETAVILFTHLALPVDVKIALHIPTIEGTPTFADLFSVMPDGPGPVLRSMRAIKFRPGPCSMAVQFSTSTAINSKYSWNPQDDNIPLSIEFVYRDFFYPPPNSVEISRNIVFDICQIIAQRRHRAFFSEELESIHLKGCEDSDFVTGLTTALRTEGSSNVRYPSLRVLELQRMRFDGNELEDLRDVLKMRAQHNVHIHNLRLTRCNSFTADQVQLFREVVVNDIDCDQYTLEHS
ncbi:uncharacterized protein BJ212DRAFT_638807 [Suillus subaureus]|uniref:F-box domain-containing protein n=1 Tax=Suillus subaureus TaxID=48587 RepID=A0A9P7E1P2_9AGAM|nr:uncharacterized protein BJ212DRAFT_638807 [Suillus subaureus]KAG1808602.1 hypothetical protein BJ212DRAFT_638807 [Suillus subaureus]